MCVETASEFESSVPFSIFSFLPIDVLLPPYIKLPCAANLPFPRYYKQQFYQRNWSSTAKLGEPLLGLPC